MLQARAFPTAPAASSRVPQRVARRLGSPPDDERHERGGAAVHAVDIAARQPPPRRARSELGKRRRGLVVGARHDDTIAPTNLHVKPLGVVVDHCAEAQDIDHAHRYRTSMRTVQAAERRRVRRARRDQASRAAEPMEDTRVSLVLRSARRGRRHCLQLRERRGPVVVGSRGGLGPGAIEAQEAALTAQNPVLFLSRECIGSGFSGRSGRSVLAACYERPSVPAIRPAGLDLRAPRLDRIRTPADPSRGQLYRLREVARRVANPSLNRALGDASDAHDITHWEHGIVGRQRVLCARSRGLTHRRQKPEDLAPSFAKGFALELCQGLALFIRATLKHHEHGGRASPGEARSDGLLILVPFVFGLQCIVLCGNLASPSPLGVVAVVGHGSAPLALAASIAYDRARTPAKLSMIWTLVVNQIEGFAAGVVLEMC